MTPFDLIGHAEESERYPGLLAWFQYVLNTSGEVRKDYLVAGLGEPPEEEGVDIVKLYERYLDRGEIAAATFLGRRYQIPVDKQLKRRRNELSDQLKEESSLARAACRQLDMKGQGESRNLALRIDAILNDSFILDYRPGLALRELKAINEGLRQALVAAE